MRTPRPDAAHVGAVPEPADDEHWRDEVVRGLLVREPRPGGEHGWVQARLTGRLLLHVEARGAGVVLTDSGYVTNSAMEYRPGVEPRALAAAEELDGGVVLPGFTLPLSELFGT